MTIMEIFLSAWALFVLGAHIYMQHEFDKRTKAGNKK